MADRYAGEHERHVILVRHQRTPAAEYDYLARSLAVLDWHVHPFTGDGSTDLMYFDQIRARILSLCGLDEALYVDPDVDIVGDLTGLPEQSDADILTSPCTLVPPQDRKFMMDIGGTRPIVYSGMFYIREDFNTLFDKVIRKFDVGSTGIPGTTAINICFFYMDTYLLEPYWHTTLWEMEHAIRDARIIHYSGRWKNIQPYATFHMKDEKRHMLVHPEKVITGYEIEPYPG